MFYLDFHDRIYHEINQVTSKKIVDIAEMLLDYYQKKQDESILTVLVEDLVMTSSKTIQIPEEFYSRLCKICMSKQATKLVYHLYCFNNGKYKSLIKIYRSMERYFQKSNETGKEIEQMKLDVFNLHYSNEQKNKSI